MAMFTEHPSTASFDVPVFAELIHRAKTARDADLQAQAWLALEAAHVVGQRHFGPHVESHVLMLGLAVRTMDWPEAAGQLFRLALVPLGHLTGRLPLGNPGRSTVSAFKPLPVRPELNALIEQARAAGFASGDVGR
ncbi:DUF3703 domain-containing protein [Hydrogenophaga sp.]|uniref:DUF3703 domain-containing protein n=1 Tax=Hydrogenophaga sp. TaxID=1904254 RepID=UPI0027254356|nr:DUF3703 domain-containing protein [Hydrogenophaga sp.]MDO8906253.1 DUF3703 domain-containing protein [Hydrogenophaga sp.]